MVFPNILIGLKIMQIEIKLIGGPSWLGGSQYILGIVEALSLLPDSSQPTIIIEDSKNIQLFNQIKKIKNIKLVTKKNGFTEKVLNLFSRYILGSNILSKHINKSNNSKIVFPIKGPGNFQSAENIYWVPDFQYKHLPENFSNRESIFRDKFYQAMFSERGIIVLSSEDAKKDFQRFFPQFYYKEVFVLNFHTFFNKSFFVSNPKSIISKYNLPIKFIYMPNQLWKHKGHMFVLEALANLAKNSINIPLVCSGSLHDYRNKHYYSEIMTFLKKYPKIIFQHLGVLPRFEQIQIYRSAAFILQPSEFEGWSSSVEEAIALGKKILLSDISVHKEQSPPNSIFFKNSDISDLEEKIHLCWINSEAGPNFKLENKAQKLSVLRCKNFARNFVNITRFANDINLDSHPNSDLVLQVMFYKLKNISPTDKFLPIYATYLSRCCTYFYPPGVSQKRIKRFNNGIKMHLDLNSKLQREYFFNFSTDEDDLNFLCLLINPGDVCIDVGANVGLFALNMSLCAGQQGKVIAFEPNQNVYITLKKNIKENNLGKRIYLSHYGLSNCESAGFLYMHADSALSSLLKLNRDPILTKCKIKTSRLDFILQKFNVNKVDFIKIDVEGFEPEVLEGSLDTLSKNDAILLIEICHKNLSNERLILLKRILLKLEKSLGYQAFLIDGKKKLKVFPSINNVFAYITAEDNFSKNLFFARRKFGKNKHLKGIFDSLFSNSTSTLFVKPFEGSLSSEKLKALDLAENKFKSLKKSFSHSGKQI